MWNESTIPEIEPGSLISFQSYGTIEITSRNLGERTLIHTRLVEGEQAINNFFELVELLTAMGGFCFVIKFSSLNDLPLIVMVTVKDCKNCSQPMIYQDKNMFCPNCKET